MSTIQHFPVLLPQKTDMSKWAVIACDQYSTDPNYWKKVSDYVGSSYSTLNLIFPEIYLKNGDIEKRIKTINNTMYDYINNNVFIKKNAFILTERFLSDGRKRIGLVASVDLEDYDYTSSNCKIRSTEDTIEERLPVRIHIRKNAPLELPHILLLMDDAKKTIIEPIYAKRDTLPLLYDFELNMNGGHIRGYEVDYSLIPNKLFDDLLCPDLQKEKYGKDAGILFAVGDGNHSMATAKKCWESLKPTLSEEELESHPARKVLCEILNVYDSALDFLPIHRNIYGIDEDVFIKKLSTVLTGKGLLTLITRKGEFTLPCPIEAEKTIIAVQRFLENLKTTDNIQIEYVHEEEQVRTDVNKAGGVGIIMPFFPKNKLFPYVVNIGKLPKKAFSIGEEKTKKYYIEAKRIK